MLTRLSAGRTSCAVRAFRCWKRQCRRSADRSASSLPVHLLFTDIRMPGEMDGVALAKFAHARFPGIKSIIGSSGRPEQSVGDFADAFLAKPYDLRELVEQVRRLLGESDYER